MDNIQRLIEQARAVMACPACGRHYAAKEITLKGYMEHTYILQTTCSNQHPTIFTTWITSYAPTLHEGRAQIEIDDVLELHQALQVFDGNFKAIWSSER